MVAKLSLDDTRRCVALLERASRALAARVVVAVISSAGDTSPLTSRARAVLKALETQARPLTTGDVLGCLMLIDPPATARKCAEARGQCRAAASCQVALPLLPLILFHCCC